MTQTADLIHKMAEFFAGEEFFEKDEDARLELSPDDVRCMNELVKRMNNLDRIKAEIMQLDYDCEDVDYDYNDMAQTEVVHTICREEVLLIIDKYREGANE